MLIVGGIWGRTRIPGISTSLARICWIISAAPDFPRIGLGFQSHENEPAVSTDRHTAGSGRRHGGIDVRIISEYIGDGFLMSDHRVERDSLGGLRKGEYLAGILGRNKILGDNCEELNREGQ